LPEDYIYLPKNRLFETWGDDIAINGNNTYIINKDKSTFYIVKLNHEYFIWLKDEYLNIIYFHDIYDPNITSNSTFMRIINNNKLYYYNGIHYII
jgi:hypothetical protein